ncbi:hypothetical protein B0H17DRAFT_1125510 [Mycena rosella]|uniref:Uncharacterized protein n=1 Tax=Mycena rosella TaxID=1033263 RepID=A0AAD7M9C6_MYCRO|nr:hypothetical protein B0H17DRAFT_1125510 [Mycena rosella]
MSDGGDQGQCRKVDGQLPNTPEDVGTRILTRVVYVRPGRRSMMHLDAREGAAAPDSHRKMGTASSARQWVQEKKVATTINDHLHEGRGRPQIPKFICYESKRGGNPHGGSCIAPVVRDVGVQKMEREEGRSLAHATNAVGSYSRRCLGGPDSCERQSNPGHIPLLEPFPAVRPAPPAGNKMTDTGYKPGMICVIFAAKFEKNVKVLTGHNDADRN